MYGRNGNYQLLSHWWFFTCNLRLRPATNAVHCISRWSQQNCCSLNKALVTDSFCYRLSERALRSLMQSNSMRTFSLCKLCLPVNCVYIQNGWSFAQSPISWREKIMLPHQHFAQLMTLRYLRVQACVIYCVKHSKIENSLTGLVLSMHWIGQPYCVLGSPSERAFIDQRSIL